MIVAIAAFVIYGLLYWLACVLFPLPRHKS